MAKVLLQSPAMCSCGPKRWTRIIATTLLVIFILVAIAGHNIAEDSVSHAKLNEDDRNALLNNVRVPIWAGCIFMAFLTLLLFIGNEKEIPVLFWPWLMFMSIGMLLAGVEAIRTMIRGPARTGIRLIICVIITAFCLHVVHRRANEFKAALNMRLSIENDTAVVTTKGLEIEKSARKKHGDDSIELVSLSVAH